MDLVISEVIQVMSGIMDIERLVLLSVAYDSDTSFTGLARRLHIAECEVAGVIKRAEKNGLLTITFSREDRRKRWAVLTDKGVKAVREFAEQVEADLQELSK